MIIAEDLQILLTTMVIIVFTSWDFISILFLLVMFVSIWDFNGGPTNNKVKDDYRGVGLFATHALSNLRSAFGDYQLFES